MLRNTATKYDKKALKWFQYVLLVEKNDAKILLINWQEIYNSLKEPKSFESYYMVGCQELMRHLWPHDL